MKKFIVILVLLMVLTSCVSSSDSRFIKRITKTPTATITMTPTVTSTLTPTATQTSTPTSTSTPTPTVVTNIFGAMIPMDTPGRLAAQALGIRYYRNINAVFASEPLSCPSCVAARADGYQLLITVRGNKSALPLTDLNAYASFITNVVTTYRPDMIVVENEESTPAFFSGTPEQYLAELNAACVAAHAAGAQCTNGGLASKSILLVIWQYVHGGYPSAAACTFAQRAFNPTEASTLCQGNISASMSSYIARTKAFYDTYGSSLIDVINMHFYLETTSSGNNLSALADAVAFMEASGKKAIVNEWGLRMDDTVVLGDAMTQLQSMVPIAIYFSPAPSAGQDVIELQNDDGSLSNLGLYFSTFGDIR